MKKLVLFAILVTVSVCSYAAIYEMTGNYRSSFNPENLVNCYKNTMTVTINSLPTAKRTLTITRTDVNDNASTVASIKLNTDGSYTITYTTTSLSPRYDDVALVTSGTVEEGGTIAVTDYFNGSTFADHIQTHQGGDVSGPYTYKLTYGSTTYGTYVVPVYLASIFVELTHPYTLEDVIDDTDHMLTPQGAHVYCTLADASTNVASWKIYREGEEWATAQTQDDDNLESINQSYKGEMTVLSDDGVANTYGTDESCAYPGIVNVEMASKAKSEYTFTSLNNEKDCRYFEGILDLAFDYKPQEGSFATRPIPTITTGGYRVWRTCTTEAEEFTPLVGRANDYLFFDNVNDDDVTSEAKNVGSEKRSYVASTKTIPYTTGVWGSSAAEPVVTYQVRAYYYMEDVGYDPFGAPKRKVSLKDDDEVQYYVADLTFKTTFKSTITTSIDDVTSTKQISSIRFCNLAGQQSNVPFSGINLVVTTFSDGTTSTTKMIK